MKQKKKQEQSAVSNENQFNLFTNSTLVVILLILIFAVQSIWHAWDKAATYDEPGHLTVSYLLCKTDHSNYEIGHPPLVRYLLALPLLMLNPSFPTEMNYPVVPDSVPLAERPGSNIFLYSTFFLYGNRVPADILLFSSRMVNIILGCFAAFILFKWSSKLYGETAGFLSLALFAFCPNLIAHGSLATTDIGGILFALLFLYSLSLLVEKSITGMALWAGFFLGLALLSKTTNIILAPLFILNYIFLKKFYGGTTPGQTPERFPEWVKPLWIVPAAAWFILCTGYKFENVFLSHTLLESDWNYLGFGKTIQAIYRYIPLPDSFLKGMCYNILHDKRGHGGFFMGHYSSLGWWYYFPAAFFLKTPTVTLLLLLGWIWLVFKKRVRLCASEIIILSTIALLAGLSMKSNVAIGLRHILLVYPLLYILLGKMATVPLGRRKILSIILFVLLAFETLSASPHYLAFFNRMAGGPEKGIDYLSDSNIDWGQDLKNCAKFLKKEGDPEILLSYFGTAVPEYYGIRYQSLPTVWSFPKSEHINSLHPKKEYLAISVTNLQGTYFTDHSIYEYWLRSKKPIAKIGYSIYVYDITNDLESQNKILEIYKMTGEVNKFLRQVGRIKNIQKPSGS